MFSFFKRKPTSELLESVDTHNCFGEGTAETAESAESIR